MLTSVTVFGISIATVLGLIGGLLGLSGYVKLIPAYATGKAKTSFYTWLLLGTLCIAAFVQPLLNGVTIAGLITPGILMVCGITVMIIAFIKETKENLVPKGFDIFSIVLIVVCGTMAFAGTPILRALGFNPNPELVQQISLTVFSTSSVFPTIMMIRGIFNGNREVPSAIALMTARTVISIFALNIWNFFTLYGPILNVLSNCLVIGFALYFNNKRDKEAQALQANSFESTVENKVETNIAVELATEAENELATN